MALFGAPVNSKIIRLSDTAGTDGWIVKDSDDFPIFKIDSKGQIHSKGRGIQRIQG